MIYIFDVLWNTVHCIVYLPVVYCCVCVCAHYEIMICGWQPTDDSRSLCITKSTIFPMLEWSIVVDTDRDLPLASLSHQLYTVKPNDFRQNRETNFFFFFPYFCGGFCTFFLVYIVELVSCPSTIRWDVPDVVFAVFYLLNNIGASSLGRIHIKLAVTDLPFFDRYSVLFLFLFDFPHFLQ